MYLDPLTLGLIVIVLALWLRWRKKKLSLFEELGIPGPKPNLICGNAYPITTKGPIECWKQWAEKYGKVYGYYLGFRPILYVGDPKLLKQIQIKDFQYFIDRPEPFRDSPMNKDEALHLAQEQGQRWKKIRSILTPSFTAARMKTMAPLMHSALEILVSKIQEKAERGEEFDIYDDYQMLTLDIFGRAAFGITTDVQKDPDNRLLVLGKLIFSSNLQSLVILLGGSFPEIPNLTIRLAMLRTALLNRGKNVKDEFVDLCAQVIKQRRENPELRRPDLLQLMLDAEATQEDINKADDSRLTAGEDRDDDDTVPAEKEQTAAQEGKMKHTHKDVERLTDKEMAVNAFLLFLAGYETTSNLLAYTTYLLAKHPEVQEKVREEVMELLEREGELKYESINKLKYMEQVMSESLRVYPPVLFFVNRECVADISYGNIKIKKGMVVQIPTYHLLHDPNFWEDPETFDPDRFSSENRSKIDPIAYQPFGAGPRNCIGMRFAQMEAKLVFAQMVRYFNFELSQRYQKKPLELKCGVITLTPLKGVYVKATRRTDA